MIYEPSKEAEDFGATKVCVEFREEVDLYEVLTHFERFLRACGFEIDSDSLEVREKDEPETP